MKYRVKEVIKGEDKTYFPQKKYRWWPFWCNFTGFDPMCCSDFVFCFERRQTAEDFIKKFHKHKTNQKEKKTNYFDIKVF